MPTTAKDLIKHFLDAMITGDEAALAQFLTDDAVWHTPPSTMEGFRGPHRGRAAVTGLLGNVAGNVYEPGSTAVSIRHIIVDGDLAAAHFEVTGRLLAGAAYENSYAYIFRLHDGFIAEVWEHVDTARFYQLLQGAATQ